MHELEQRLNTEWVVDWTRPREIEARLRNSLPPRTSSFCFSKRIPAGGRQVAVLFRGRGPTNPEELFVSGIVPLEGRDLFSLKDHDEVINDVRDTFLEPVARGLPVRILVYRVHVGPALEDSLSPEALARLRASSETSNKAILHALDLRQWAGFIKQAHVDDAVIDSGMLAEWLMEEGFQGINVTC